MLATITNLISNLVLQSSCPQLAVEIWERVIDQLRQYPRELSKCSLVCKSWYARAHYHLIATTTLFDPRQVYRLGTLLREFTALRARVKQVIIRGAGGRQSQARRPVPHFCTFGLMFARKLPAVESLCIYDATWQVGPNQSSVFVHLESFTSITELRLLRTTFPTKLVLAQLICALPRLTTLACTVVDFRSPVWNSAAFIAVPPRVKDLRLDGPSDDVAELFATQLGIAASMEAFTMGWAYTAQDVPSEAAILSMLRRTGPILRSANIRLRRPSGTSPSVHLKKPGDQVRSASKGTFAMHMHNMGVILTLGGH